MERAPNARQTGDLVRVAGLWYEVTDDGGLTPYADLDRARRIARQSASTLEKDSLKPQPRFPVVRLGRRRLWLINGLMPDVA